MIRYDNGTIDRCEMNWRNGVLYIFLLCLAAGLTANPVSAQTRVGEAAVIQNEVVRVTGSANSQINVGDSVLRDEIVRTGLESAARLVMADSTNLSLGPSATIKLDRTVFSDEHSYRDIAIGLTSGAFRFVTGHSEKTAYKINTPLATIGVRGTTLDILNQRARNIIVLQDGQGRVCAAGQCVDLLLPGDSAVITVTNGKIQITKTSAPPWTFASSCAANAALCSQTTFAELTIPGTPEIDVDFASALCGK
jgi:hypothetical protein